MHPKCIKEGEVNQIPPPKVNSSLPAKFLTYWFPKREQVYIFKLLWQINIYI